MIRAAAMADYAPSDTNFLLSSSITFRYQRANFSATLHYVDFAHIEVSEDPAKCKTVSTGKVARIFQKCVEPDPIFFSKQVRTRQTLAAYLISLSWT